MGSLHNVVDAVGICKTGGVGPVIGGSCSETDRSARASTHISIATAVVQMLAKPGMGVDAGLAIVINEMNRAVRLDERLMANPSRRSSQLMSPRTFLYVPGDQPDRLSKSGRFGADAIIVNLEDAVLPEAKAAALHNTKAWLRDRDPSEPAPWVRLNEGHHGVNEVGELAGSPGLAAFFLPKVGQRSSSPKSGAPTRSRPCRRRNAMPVSSNALLAPLIESAEGVIRIEELAGVPGSTSCTSARSTSSPS